MCPPIYSQSRFPHKNLPGRDGILYYLKFENTIHKLWKIGITNFSIKERFAAQDLEYITPLWTRQYEIGRDAYNEEQRILQKFKDHRYLGKDKTLISGGNTELFTKDILCL